MAIGKQSMFDVRSAYEAAAAEKYGHETLADYYESLLLSGRQYASNVSGQYYEQGSQRVAEKASYDISGAYANYLKQQRNVAAQGHLESGYKEEVKNLLQNQYASAYSQAKSTQVQNLTELAKETETLYSTMKKESDTAATQLYNTLIEDVNNKTALFKAVESKMLDETTLAKLGVSSGYKTESGEEVKFDIYKNTADGVKFSDYGLDVVSRLLASEDMQHYLEEEDLLEYYLSNPQKLNEELFGVTDTEYRLTEESKELSNQRLFGTTGYIDSFNVESVDKVDFRKNDFYVIDGGVSLDEKLDDAVKYLTEYGTKIGLTQEEISSVTNSFTADVKNLKKAEGSPSTFLGIDMNKIGSAFGIGTGADRDSAERLYYAAAEKLKETAKNKYTK